MNVKFGKLLMTSRLHAGMTQEQASEALGVSVKSLSNYENGVTMVPDDVMARMMTLYCDEGIGWIYLPIASQVARRLLPEFSAYHNMAAAALDLDLIMRAYHDDFRHKVAAIVIDNRIDNTERPTWEQFVDTFLNRIVIVAAYFKAAAQSGCRLSAIEKKKPPQLRAVKRI